MTVSVTRLSKPKPAFIAFERLKRDVATNVIAHVRYLSCSFTAFQTHQHLLGATRYRVVLRRPKEHGVKIKLHDFVSFHHVGEPFASHDSTHISVITCI